MKIALVGGHGQLGRALHALLGDDLVPLAREQLDITDAVRVDSVLAELRPDRVINAAAWNFVDRAEDEPQTAFSANALGPRNLARWCAEAAVPLVHVSTDYVFSGLLDDGGRRFLPYRETDRPDPLSAYAVSKLAGEQFVRAICREHLIVRSCGLYGAVGDGRQPAERKAERKGNFVETMLRLGGERRELRVVDDQECTPTSTADLAQMIAALLAARARGTFHATSAGSATWCEFARTIFRLAGMNVQVHPITTADYGTKAARPGYSVLSAEKLTRATGHAPRPWPEALETYLAGRSR